MDSRQLRYFITVYEQRNLSRTADQVNVAQSALSHHISNLEAEFATPLFERKPRGMEPTAAGERLYEHARIILRAMAAAEREIREGSSVIAGDISIGMANSGVKAIGVSLMKAVLAKYPNLKLSLTESLSGATLLHLLASEVDLALVYNPPSEKDLIAEPVLEEQMFCVGTAKLIGKSKAPITFEAVTRLPLLTLLHGLSSRALLDDPVLLKRLEANAILQLNSISGMTGALLAGLGCAVATKLFVKEQLQAGTLIARGNRAEINTHALSLPAAQPPDDLRDGRDAPADPELDRRAGRAGRLAGDAAHLTEVSILSNAAIDMFVWISGSQAPT